MSGIEVAGIVLAVLPLFISAAQNYKEGLNAGKRALKMNIFLEQYTRELTAQSALLVCYLKEMIGRTSLQADIQKDLVKDPIGDWWTDPEVVEVISEALGDAYQPFMDTLHTICKVLISQIQEDLGRYFVKTDQVRMKFSSPQPRDSPSINLAFQSTDVGKLHKFALEKERFNLRTRLNFSWRSSERTALLEEFKYCTELLGKLSRAAERAEPYKRQQKSHQTRKAYYEWRNDIKRLLGIICKCFECQSCSMHEVSLRLQKFADGDPESEFAIMLHNSYDTYCEFSIAVERSQVKQVKQQAGLEYLPQAPLVVTTSTSRLQRTEVRGDICQEVRSANSRNVGLQLFLSEREELFALQEASDRVKKRESQAMLTLNDIMIRLKPFRQKKWLRKEKALLAVVLADSLLQLSSSPWSQTCWDSQTFTFKDPDYHLNLRRPYTMRHPVSKMNIHDSSNLLPTLRKNAQIHALGILLLELYLNYPIDEAAGDEFLLSPISTASSSPIINLNLRRSLAQDLLQEHADDDDMTPQYYEAVRFCLSPRPNPDSRSFSFEDAGFREIFFREVVANLEASLREKWEVSDNIWREET